MEDGLQNMDENYARNPNFYSRLKHICLHILAHSFGVHSLWLVECPEILGVGRVQEIEGILSSVNKLMRSCRRLAYLLPSRPTASDLFCLLKIKIHTI